MSHEPGGTNWSVVMTAWEGAIYSWEKVGVVAEKTLGRKGLDTFSLTLFGKEHLPAELADNLPREQAEELATRLSEIGAIAKALPTAEVTDLKHRASEVWATHCTASYCFTEIEGLIFSHVSLNARDNLARTRRTQPEWASWQIERSMNHSHLFDQRSYDQSIEDAEEATSKLKSALQEAYPDRAFTMSLNTSIFSFWQTTPDSPREEYLCDREKVTDKGWCMTCKRMRSLRASNKVHPRFVEAQWGICEECGAGVMITGCSKLLFIEPMTKTNHD